MMASSLGSSIGQLSDLAAAALRAARTGTWRWDIAEDVVIWDEPLCDVYGVDREGAATTAAEFLGFVHPDDRDSVSGLLGRSVETGTNLEYEFRSLLPDGSIRWIYDRSKFVLDDQGRPLSLIGTCTDITERKEAELALRDSESRLRLALDAARMAVWEYYAKTDRIAHSPDLNRLLGFPLDATPSLDEMRAGYAPGEEKRVRDAGATALASGERFFEVQFGYIRHDRSPRWLLLRAEIRLASDGTPDSVIGVLIDMTDQKLAVERERLLTQELTHRSNNLLAMVQAMVSQTLRDATDLAMASDAVAARIRNLAKAHELLSEHRWLGANVADVVQQTLKPLVSDLSRIQRSGPDVTLAPRLAVNVSVILHELMTNAIKYGSLSNNIGRVAVRWRMLPQRAETLQIEWRETGGPPVAPPATTGFGRRLISGLTAEVGSSAEFDFDEGGLAGRLTFLLNEHSAEELDRNAEDDLVKIGSMSEG